MFGGSYFKGIDLWFSDTFQFREQLIAANGSIQKLYGIHTVQINGNVENGDDIPDAPVHTTKPVITQNTTTEPSTIKESTTEPADLGETQTFGAMLLVGDRAFEYYNFRTGMADRYAAMINKTASRLKGISTVYDMIVPTSIGIMIPDSMRNSINSSDQKKAIKYMYSSMSDQVQKVSVYDTLIDHKSEYVYYRTDHHWTALGAYYGYEQFAAAKGIKPIPLAKYEKISYKGFLGSFYSEAKKDPGLGKHPDTVDAYKPYNNTSMKFTDHKGNAVTWEIITDVSNWTPGTKYNTFIGGDNPYTIINNTDLTNKTSCLVVKESYGNAFIPFLVAHYQTIHVIDYRYWNGDFVNFVKTNHIKDVLFINNISATRSEPLIADLEKLTGR
ncbi:MAG: DHHW family protein [Eubacteriales bacterium]